MQPTSAPASVAVGSVPPRVCVIGAGVAGIACVKELTAWHIDVDAYDMMPSSVVYLVVIAGKVGSSRRPRCLPGFRNTRLTIDKRFLPGTPLWPLWLNVPNPRESNSYTLGQDGVEKFVATPELQSADHIGHDPLPPGQVWTISPGGQDEGSGLYRIEVTELV